MSDFTAQTYRQAIAQRLDELGDKELAGTTNVTETLELAGLAAAYPGLTLEAAGSEPGGGPVADLSDGQEEVVRYLDGLIVRAHRAKGRVIRNQTPWAGVSGDTGLVSDAFNAQRSIDAWLAEEHYQAKTANRARLSDTVAQAVERQRGWSPRSV